MKCKASCGKCVTKDKSENEDTDTEDTPADAGDEEDKEEDNEEDEAQCSDSQGKFKVRNARLGCSAIADDATLCDTWKISMKCKASCGKCVTKDKSENEDTDTEDTPADAGDEEDKEEDNEEDEAQCSDSQGKFKVRNARLGCSAIADDATLCDTWKISMKCKASC
eukprot:143993_1